MGLHTWDIPQLVQTILTGLVLFPAMAIFALVLSKPGAKHDYTLKWVDFTKVAFGLWSASHLFSFIASIMLLVIFSRQYWGHSLEIDIISYFYVVSLFLDIGAQVTFFLAIFYLAHAFTQLRIGAGANETQQFRIGQKGALGVSALLALIALAVFSLGVAMVAMLSSTRGSGNFNDYDTIVRINIAREYLYYINLGILTVTALAVTVYAIAARRKERDSPVAKAATLLLVSASLWLSTLLWTVISILVARFAPFPSAYRYMMVIDVFLRVWPSFATLLVLYLLASSDSYGLSRIHYRVNDDEEQDA
ncbi:hypothetical protein CkaCkLH20_12108 [Colletotrichum karsti]|uniref:Uncharacterized protein n=1 Tax=Colletotrichum karsti TaxID=1095194 RepID=A0A9P6HY36_9PEZI|nr:uncharacterized protein CkaCkLH20_12108 [Colletotrichum karsti]KAF9870441.1 hypothetical protein CkaCkLH20_12108 [Colletotrichum karsti]